MTDLIMNNDGLIKYMDLLVSKIYKILPLSEEGLDWQKHTESLIIELHGYIDLVKDVRMFEVMFSLRGLIVLEYKTDIKRIVFSLINIVKKIKQDLKGCDVCGL